MSISYVLQNSKYNFTINIKTIKSPKRKNIRVEKRKILTLHPHQSQPYTYKNQSNWISPQASSNTLFLSSQR